MLFILAAQEKTDSIRIRLIEKLILNISIGFTTSNFIDKRIFGVQSYTKTDILMVIVVILVSYYDFRKLKKLVNPQQ